MLAAAAAPTGVDTGTYLDTRPAFLLDERPWLERIAYSTRGHDSLGTLARMLQTGCYILIAYLTGMRDSEIKHLTRGCVTTGRDSTGSVYRWRSPAWRSKAKPPPRRPRHLGRRTSRRPRRHRPGTPPATRSELAVRPPALPRGHPARLVSRCAHHCRHPECARRLHRLGQHLLRLCWPHRHHSWRRRAADHQAVRRTLAWHIARRPGRVIAGALQYRHHAIQMFESYAATSASGFRAEVEAEQAITRGEHLLAMTDLHQHHQLTSPAAAEAAARLNALLCWQAVTGVSVGAPPGSGLPAYRRTAPCAWASM